MVGSVIPSKEDLKPSKESPQSSKVVVNLIWKALNLAISSSKVDPQPSKEISQPSWVGCYLGMVLTQQAISLLRWALYSVGQTLNLLAQAIKIQQDRL